MSARLLMISLALVIGVGSANAQGLRKPDKLVRRTYGVAELVVPIPYNQEKSDGKTTEDTLLNLITATIAKESWDSVGGDAVIRYFPTGMAMVVLQRESVHEEIENLLASLRKLQEVQICVEVRLVLGSARLLKTMDKFGQSVKSLGEPEPPNRFVSLDEKQLFDFLGSVQGDRKAHIMQMPKVTMLNGQKATVASTTIRPNDPREHGPRCELLPIVDAEQKLVRLSVNLQFLSPEIALVKAAGTFNIASGRTLVWHLGEANVTGAKKRPHLYVLVSPRAMVVKEELVFKGHGGAEEQSVPAPKAQPPAVGVEMRFVSTSGATAKRWLKEVTKQTVALDDQQMQTLLDLTASDRASTIVQVPRIRLVTGTPVRFEYAHKEAATTEFRLPDSEPLILRKEKVVGAWRCELQRGEFASADGQDVLLSLTLTQHREASDADPLVRRRLVTS